MDKRLKLAEDLDLQIGRTKKQVLELKQSYLTSNGWDITYEDGIFDYIYKKAGFTSVDVDNAIYLEEFECSESA